MAYGYPDNYYSVMLDSQGDIYEINGYQQGRKIGVDIRREQEYIGQFSEAAGLIESYYSSLVSVREYLVNTYNDKEMVEKLSAFAPKVTPEEIAAEQLRIAQEQAERQSKLIQTQNIAMAKMMSMLETMENKLGGMENGDSRNGNEPRNEPIGQDSQGSGEAGRSDKKRNSASVKVNS